MKALSIRQPWAWAILYANKDIENRDWNTHFRGRVAVHAAKGMTSTELGRAVQFFYRIGAVDYEEYPARQLLVRGAIVGTVEIVDCVTESDSPWFLGKYGFVLADPRPLPTPIPCSGALGFWNVPAVIETRMTERRPYTTQENRVIH